MHLLAVTALTRDIGVKIMLIQSRASVDIRREGKLSTSIIYSKVPERASEATRSKIGSHCQISLYSYQAKTEFIYLVLS